MLTDTRKSKYAKMSAPAYGQTVWNGGFWKETVDACASQMVPQLQHMFESPEISHVVENFRICCGDTEGSFDGTVFGDGDFYKWMESELYSGIQLRDNSRLEQLDAYIDLIARSQQPDGYISTKQIIESRQGIGGGRHGDINEFEVYNMGHLFTSACLHKRLTGKDNFLAVAEKAADYLKHMYEEGEKNGDVQTAVCPSHYMGLIELYRTTGKEEYLQLAQKAIELRDAVKNGLDDNQDRYPLKSHDRMIGHAVRASYLYAGVTDLYAETGDCEYLEMLHRVWDSMVNHKIYITGGIGALYNGVSPYGDFLHTEYQKVHQAFGYEYQLPNVTAYNETCAGIGLVMWAYRMFLVEGDAKYFDLIERVMLNTNLAAVSMDGRKYFYENMLRRSKKEEMKYNLLWELTRTEYILSYCCPPNLARCIMQAGEYAYTQAGHEIWTGLYGENELRCSREDGARFTLVQHTDYPYDGRIRFTFAEIEQDGPVMLHIRIPEWSEHSSLTVNGTSVEIRDEDRGTYVDVKLDSVYWDDRPAEILLALDMQVRFTIANSMVEEDAGQAAIECGPLVYCVESVDTEAEALADLALDPTMKFEREAVVIGGRQIAALRTEADLLCRESFHGAACSRSALYQPLKKLTRRKTSLRLIPYFAWDNRGYGEMRIWFPYL